MSSSAENPAEQGSSRSSSAAFFDVDGTLVSTHIVHQYIYLRKVLTRRHGGPLRRLLHPCWLVAFYVRCLEYLYLDRISRTRMNIAFYRNYAGLSCKHVRQAAEVCFRSVLEPHLFDQGAACVAEHLQAGRRVVLVTGSIDFLIKPLARHLAAAVAPQAEVTLLARTLLEHRGRFTGALDGPPIGEREKAAQVKRYAEREGIDLASSYAYGDSIADLQMLEAVGFPQVVNADRALAETAGQRGWPVQEWRLERNGA